jgi:hypothetical protein
MGLSKEERPISLHPSVAFRCTCLQPVAACRKLLQCNNFDIYARYRGRAKRANGVPAVEPERPVAGRRRENVPSISRRCLSSRCESSPCSCCHQLRTPTGLPQREKGIQNDAIDAIVDPIQQLGVVLRKVVGRVHG